MVQLASEWDEFLNSSPPTTDTQPTIEPSWDEFLGAAPSSTPPSPLARPAIPLASDAVHALTGGAIGGTKDLVEGLTAPFTGASNAPADWLREKAQGQLAQISPQGRAEMEKPIFTGEGLSDLGVNRDLTGTGMLLKTAQGLGSIAPSIAGGGLAMKGLQAVGRVDALRRAAATATTAAQTSGLGADAIKALPEVAKLRRAEDLTAAGGFGAMTGAMQAGSAADTARQEMLRRGRTPEEAEQAAKTAARIAGGVGLVSGALGGPLEKKIFLDLDHTAADAGMNLGKSMLRRGGQGMATEAGQELVESGSEQLGVNAGVGNPLMRNVPQTGLEGAVVGGITGGLGGATSAVSAKAGKWLMEPIETDPTEEPVPPSDVPSTAPQVQVNEFTRAAQDRPASTRIDQRAIEETNPIVGKISSPPGDNSVAAKETANAAYPTGSTGELAGRPAAQDVGAAAGERPSVRPVGPAGIGQSTGASPEDVERVPPTLEANGPTGRGPAESGPTLTPTELSNVPAQSQIESQAIQSAPEIPAAAGQQVETQAVGTAAPDQVRDEQGTAQGAGLRPDGRPAGWGRGRPDDGQAPVPAEEAYVRSYAPQDEGRLDMVKVKTPVMIQHPDGSYSEDSEELPARQALDSIDQRYNFARRLILCLDA